MHRNRYFWKTRASWAVLTVLGLATAATAIARADQTYADPVEQLRQALKTAAPPDPARSPEELTARRDLLTKRVEALRNLGDLRRALLINEWLDEDTDPLIRAVDGTIRDQVVARLQKLLRAAMAGSDPAGKLAAATMIGEMGVNVKGTGTKSGLARVMGPDLATLSKDPNPRVQEAAVRALGEIDPDPKVAVPALAALLKSDDVGVRRATASALGSMIQKVLQIISLRGKSPSGVEATPLDVVQVAVAVVPLAAQGLSDTDVDVRRRSIEAIQAAAVALTDLVPSPDSRRPLPSEVGRTTRPPLDEERVDVAPLARALGEQGAALAKVQGDVDPQVRLLARRALEDMANARQRLTVRRSATPAAPPPPPPPPKKIGDARTDATPGPTDMALAGAMVALEEAYDPTTEDSLLKGLQKSLAELAAGLNDPDVKVRLASLDVLETMGEDAAPVAAAVIKSLDDPNMFVRWSAIRTLGKLGTAEESNAVPALIRLLNDKDLDVRLATALVLEKYGPGAAPAIGALSRTVGTGDAEVRIAAMKALEAIGKDAYPATDAISGALANSDSRVRRTAAEVLGSFGPAARSAEPNLRRVLTDDDADVRRAASDALLGILPSSDK